MKVLLLGASSYLGARLYIEMQHVFDLVGTFSSHKISDVLVPLNITDKEAVVKLIQTVKPEVIIHAANNASATWCTVHPIEAVSLNQTSMKYVIDAANAVHAKIIYISSFSANDHSNVYGRTKFEAERILKQSAQPYCIIRPSLIVGFSPNTQNDRPFNRMLKNIDEKIPAMYDTSWRFQPTYIRHIYEVIYQIIKKDIQSEIVSVAVSEVKSRYDIAKDILTPYNITVTPVDANDTGAYLTDDLQVLQNLGLPTYSYDDVVQLISKEIQNRTQYTI